MFKKAKTKAKKKTRKRSDGSGGYNLSGIIQSPPSTGQWKVFQHVFPVLIFDVSIHYQIHLTLMLNLLNIIKYYFMLSAGTTKMESCLYKGYGKWQCFVISLWLKFSLAAQKRSLNQSEIKDLFVEESETQSGS